MSALLVVGIAVALGLLVAVLSASVLLPVWGGLARRVRGLARLHVAVAALPWILGGLAVLAVLVPGDPHTRTFLACHCAEQPGWWHLCMLHPWSSWPLLLPSALVLSALAPGPLVRAVLLLREPLGPGGGAVPRVVALDEPAVLLHGWLRPGLVVDRALWSDLDDEDRAVVIAHERGHLLRWDPAVLMALRALVVLVPRPLSRAFLASWLAHAERQADAAAAEEIGDPLRVAAALLRAARRSLRARPAALGWTGASVEDRVRSLLMEERPAEDRPAPDVSVVDAVVLVLFAASGLTAVPWLHHQLEHLLNLSL